MRITLRGHVNLNLLFEGLSDGSDAALGNMKALAAFGIPVAPVS